VALVVLLDVPFSQVCLRTFLIIVTVHYSMPFHCFAFVPSLGGI
jgi:hypothetical protein